MGTIGDRQYRKVLSSSNKVVDWPNCPARVRSLGSLKATTEEVDISSFDLGKITLRVVRMLIPRIPRKEMVKWMVLTTKRKPDVAPCYSQNARVEWRERQQRKVRELGYEAQQRGGIDGSGRCWLRRRLRDYHDEMGGYSGGQGRSGMNWGTRVLWVVIIILRFGKILCKEGQVGMLGKYRVDYKGITRIVNNRRATWQRGSRQ